VPGRSSRPRWRLPQGRARGGGAQAGGGGVALGRSLLRPVVWSSPRSSPIQNERSSPRPVAGFAQGGGVGLGPLLPDPGMRRGARPAPPRSRAAGGARPGPRRGACPGRRHRQSDHRILLLEIQRGMRKKTMHDMWDPLTSTLYDMWDPLTVLKLPSIPYFVPPTK
jgi:hypothetical protein